MRASRRAGSRSERRIGAESTVGLVFGCATIAHEAAGGGGAGAGVEVLLVLLAGHAQVHVRVHEAREAGAGPAVDDLGASALQVGADLGDLAVADQHVEAVVEARARVEDVGAADQDVARASIGRWSSIRRAPAVQGGRGRLAAGEQLEQDGHAHDDAGLDLLADHGLRRVDHLGGELDAAVDRAGVHEDLVRLQAAAVDLVLGGVLAQRSGRSCRSCARSASAARRRRRPP